jgi:hypothetical protein
MPQPTFLSLKFDEIARLTGVARRRIVFGAPGLDQGLAAALVNASKRLPKDSVTVLLDVAEDNCRVGYGECEGYSILLDGQVAVRACPGLRIGFLLIDDEGYIFAMPALMVEDVANRGTPNAIRATPDQVILLVDATKPDFKPPVSGHGVPQQDSEPPTLFPTSGQNFRPGASPNHQQPGSKPEIGTVAVSPQSVIEIADRIKANPVQDFDLTRVVRVFSAHMQFVEFKVEGAQLKSRTVALPRETLSSIRDKRTRERMKTTFKLVPENSSISGDQIKAAANDIRERYLVHHKICGSVMLKAKRDAFEKEVAELKKRIEAYKDEIRKVYQKERERSKAALVQACWRALSKEPPKSLLARIVEEKPTMEEAKAYAEDEIDKVLPTLDDVCEGMSVSLVIKDVTWEMLNNGEFVEWLREKYKHAKELKEPFESYTAARGRTAPPQFIPKQRATI